MERKKPNYKIHGLQTTRPPPWVRGAKPAAIAALLLAAFVSEALGEAWVLPPDGYYFKLSGSWVRTEDEFNYLGDKQSIFAEDATRSNVLFRDISANAYFEYGLLRYLTLITSTQFKNVRTWATITPLVGVTPQQAIRTNYGMADWWIRLRTPLLQKKVVVSLQAGAKIPLGYESQPENEGPPLGTGEVDGDAALYLGYSFWPVAVYMEAGMGYRVRGGDLHDEVFYMAEVGYARDQLFAKVRFDGINNTVDPPDIAGFTIVTPAPGGVLNQVVVGDQDVYQVSGEFNVGLYKNMSLSAELIHLFAGKDTISGTSVLAGIVFSRK